MDHTMSIGAALAHLYPCLRFAVHLTVSNAKLEAEWFATPFS